MTIQAGGLEIEGVSIAGHESFYKVPAFRCLLEFGRAPDDVLGYATVCLTHGHLDHAAGLAHHASRRRLTGLPPARVFAPEEAAPDLEGWLAISERLENVDYGVHVTPAVPGQTVDLRNDLALTFLPGRHRVPTVGYLFSEVRKKLTTSSSGIPRRRSSRLREAAPRSLAARRSRCSPIPATARPRFRRGAGALSRARAAHRVLVPGTRRRERARKYDHIHLDDIAERASLFENEAIVLTHFSMRYRPEEIRAALRALPARILERVIAFLPPVEAGESG